MFRKSSSSTHYLLSNGSCSLQANEAQLASEGTDASPLPCLVYYSAVAKGTAILAEHVTEGNIDLPRVASVCLENVPPLHSRFSYTTNQRRFICLLDGVLIYCAIMDEALSKADAFSFLQKVRDAFKSFGKERGMSLTLGGHFLDEEMVPVMQNLASSCVGVPQREKIHIDTELQAQRDGEVDLEVSSPSAVAPLYEMSDREFDSKTEEKPLGSRSPWIPLIGKLRKGKKRCKEQGQEVMVAGEDQGKVTGLEILADRGTGTGTEKSKDTDVHKLWRRKVMIVVVLDVIACITLLVVWLAVCQGISCLKT